ncbi:hypothetical protein [Asticcacaulis sp. 201]|uniref:hypothetical protein n=1 Tax=Asticcacaulis sp. 201 TaxID=3028787 RepID=UPI0029166074|nr:hypothetical protein [Asticcacaulis sp. 201]MDV6330448.1 hypothetical protein [Asticcacaulis sp. 201]
MADMYPLYISLRDLMVRAAPAMKIGKEVQGEMTLNVPTDVMQSRDPAWFGTVRLSGNTVSYYLPPLAMRQGRDLRVPDALKKHAQSKTCFVFQDVAPERFAELEDLTQQAAQAFAA